MNISHHMRASAFACTRTGTPSRPGYGAPAGLIFLLL